MFEPEELLAKYTRLKSLFKKQAEQPPMPQRFLAAFSDTPSNSPLPRYCPGTFMSQMLRLAPMKKVLWVDGYFQSGAERNSDSVCDWPRLTAADIESKRIFFIISTSNSLQSIACVTDPEFPQTVLCIDAAAPEQASGVYWPQGELSSEFERVLTKLFGEVS